MCCEHRSRDYPERWSSCWQGKVHLFGVLFEMCVLAAAGASTLYTILGLLQLVAGILAIIAPYKVQCRAVRTVLPMSLVCTRPHLNGGRGCQEERGAFVFFRGLEQCPDLKSATSGGDGGEAPDGDPGAAAWQGITDSGIMVQGVLFCGVPGCTAMSGMVQRSGGKSFYAGNMLHSPIAL